MGFRSLVLLLAVAFSPSSFADDCMDEIPKDPIFDFARSTLKRDVSLAEKERMLERSCEVLSTDPSNIWAEMRVRDQAVEGRGTADFLIHVTTVWRKMGKEGVEKEYSAKLDEIAKIRDPDERIARTYQLAQKYQGRYNSAEADEISAGNFVAARKKAMPRTGLAGVLSTPSDVLKNARETGIGGVCRDFSALLAWSLNRVSRSPGGHARQEFLAEMTTVPGHLVVTVKRFENPNSGLAKVYSLDPTNNPEFTPIPYPDFKISEAKAEKNYDACISIRQCLAKTTGSRIAPRFRSMGAGVVIPSVPPPPVSWPADLPLPPPPKGQR